MLKGFNVNRPPMRSNKILHLEGTLRSLALAYKGPTRRGINFYKSKSALFYRLGGDDYAHRGRLSRTMRARTHAHGAARPPQRAAIRRARRAPRLRPHAIALHSGTLARCVRKKRTPEVRGAAAERTAARPAASQQSTPHGRSSTPPPYRARTTGRSRKPPPNVLRTLQCQCHIIISVIHDFFATFLTH